LGNLHCERCNLAAKIDIYDLPRPALGSIRRPVYTAAVISFGSYRTTARNQGKPAGDCPFRVTLCFDSCALLYAHSALRRIILGTLLVVGVWFMDFSLRIHHEDAAH